MTLTPDQLGMSVHDEGAPNLSDNYALPTVPNNEQLVWVNPKSVDYILRMKPNSLTKHPITSFGHPVPGLILPDEYIETGELFLDNEEVKALHGRYVKGLPWEETGYRKIYDKRRATLEDFKRAFPEWSNYQNDKLKAWDGLFENIKKSGYKAHKVPRKNIEVAVNKSGDVLFVDGKHRLYFAQLLGIESIPVIVNIWSEALCSRTSEPGEPAELSTYIS